MTTRERLTTLAQWVGLGSVVGVLCGAGSALFLWLLELVTELRTSRPLLVYALPVAGLAIGFIYQRHGSSIKAGNNLVIDTIHDDGPEIPRAWRPWC